MRDYCGKNGCYEIFEGDDEEQEILAIYLNSPLVYEDVEGQCIRATSKNRTDPEVEFIVERVSSSDNEREVEDLVISMVVNGIGMNGVNEFVSALLKLNIGDKNELIKSVQKLLDEDDAVWGIVQPDDNE